MESFSEGGKRWLAAASIKMSRNVKAHILHHISLGTQNPACHGNINKITPSHEVIEAMWSNIPQLWQWHDIGIDFVPDFSICFWRVRVCQCAPRRQCRGPSCWGWCPPEHGKSQCSDTVEFLFPSQPRPSETYHRAAQTCLSMLLVSPVNRQEMGWIAEGKRVYAKVFMN